LSQISSEYYPLYFLADKSDVEQEAEKDEETSLALFQIWRTTSDEHERKQFEQTGTIGVRAQQKSQ